MTIIAKANNNAGNIDKTLGKQVLKPLIFISLATMMSVGLVGCFDIDQESRRAKPQVDIQKTAPLEAGMSVAKSMSRNTISEQSNPNLTENNNDQEAVSLTPTDDAVIDKKSAKKINAEQPSIVKNKVTPGTPEATLKKAMDTLYYGEAKEAAQYYQVEMDNFADVLEDTQATFQKTVESLTIVKTEYNDKKTEATLECKLKTRGSATPEARGFLLKKIDGKWKIMG